MRKNVFITGGSGLLAINWALTIRDRFSVTLGLYDRDVSLSNIKTQYLNLDSVNDISSYFDKNYPDIVIHTAGLTNVEICEIKPELAQHVNVDLSSNIARVCSRLGIQMVHISTDHLFDGSNPLLNETIATSPNNVYGLTKATAEIRVLEENSEALVIRTNFYGWGPSYRHSFSDTIIESLRSGKKINLFKDVFYTPILAQTLANTVHELVNKKATGVYNVVGDERISKHEFGLKLANQYKLDSKLINSAYLAEQKLLVKRPFDMSLSNKKVCDMLGRKLGSVDQHIKELIKLEQIGIAHEIQNI